MARSTGKGISAAELTFVRDGTAFTAVSDPDGAFRFVPPSPGTYQLLSVDAAGFTPFAPGWGDSPLAFTARAGLRVTGIVIELSEKPPGAQGRSEAPEQEHELAISGHVLSHEGAPAADVLVSARRDDDPFASKQTGWSATTGPDGSFRIEHVPPGRYDLVATAPGDVPARADKVPAGASGVELRLQSGGGWLAGTVTSRATGKPVASFAVVVSRPVGQLEEEPVTARSYFDPDGQFRLGPLEPGTFRVRIAAGGYATAKQQDVTLVTGATTELDVALDAGGTIVGDVADAVTGHPLAGARVALDGSMLAPSLPIPIETATFSDGDGEFALHGVTAGTHSITASAIEHDSRVVSGIQVPDAGDSDRVDVSLSPVVAGESPKIEVTGIGAALAGKGDGLLVGKVLPGGGAADAGIVPGDVIVDIDGAAVTDLGFRAAIEHIRGPVGTVVTLVIRRGNGQQQTMHVERKLVRG